MWQRVASRTKRSFLPRHVSARPISFDVTTVLGAVQYGMVSLHSALPTDWWATIALSTVGLRFAMLPLVRKQILVSRKVSSAVPEIQLLFNLLRERVQQNRLGNVEENTKVVSVFFKGVRSCLVLNDVSVFQLVIYPVINATIFITFVVAVRDMVLHAPESLHMDQGGMLWFTDLMDKDKFFLLPLLAASTSYVNVDITLGQHGSKSKMMNFFRDSLQCLTIVSLPFVFNLPAGVFCYWIPNGFFTMAQIFALKNEKVIKLLGLPPLPPSMKPKP